MNLNEKVVRTTNPLFALDENQRISWATLKRIHRVAPVFASLSNVRFHVFSNLGPGVAFFSSFGGISKAISNDGELLDIGGYQFYLTSDDGSKLYVNDKLDTPPTSRRVIICILFCGIRFI